GSPTPPLRGGASRRRRELVSQTEAPQEVAGRRGWRGIAASVGGKVELDRSGALTIASRQPKLARRLVHREVAQHEPRGRGDRPPAISISIQQRKAICA